MRDEDQEYDAPSWLRIEGTLMSTARSIRKTYDGTLRSLGLTLPEASLITYVTEEGPITQTQIARALDTGRAATGVRIDSLEERRLIKRMPDPTDRRVWLVTATTEGRVLAKQVNELDSWLRVEMRSGISRDERRSLTPLLLQMQKNLELLSALSTSPGSKLP